MQKLSRIRTPRLSRRLPAVRLGYVTENALTERAWKDAVQGLGNDWPIMSNVTEIIWPSSGGEKRRPEIRLCPQASFLTNLTSILNVTI